MSQLFQSSAYLDSACRSDLPIDLVSLPAFLRVLLTTDGTVTKSLEAFFWEPVIVHCTFQDYKALEADEPYIKKHTGDKVLQRRVVLVGKETRREYVKANSLINTDMLPPELKEKLEAGTVGIGELLRDLGLETYREIISVGEMPEGVWRLYRIVMEHCPFIQIKETFPLHLYT